MTAELALTRPDPTMDHESLKTMMQAAQRYVDSGLLPDGVNTPQKALVVMTAGRELGVPATYALRNIHVVKGKPTCSAELMLALVRRAYGPAAIRVSATSNTACTVQYREQGWDGISEYTFTIEDARAAGVTNSGTWKSFPAAMLRARCISAVVRFAFPECISGLYTPEELGADVRVADDGSVVDVRSTSAPIAPPTLKVVDGDFEEAPGEPDLCDEAHFRAYWHAAVKGTRFADTDTRHKFIGWYTKGQYDSLGGFLKIATTTEATALIEAIQKRIESEARKARENLEAALSTAIERGNAAGGDFTPSKDIADLTDDEIREMIGVIEASLEAVAVPE